VPPALEPGTYPFTVFRLVELAAGFGFVYACWLLIGDRLNEIRTWLNDRSRIIDREPCVVAPPVFIAMRGGQRRKRIVNLQTARGWRIS
jgi:hypothetical protein